jgi:hypothetical protein
LCLAFALGVLFSRAHQESLSRQEHPLQAPGAWLVVAFGVVFWGPAMGYLMLRDLAWALSYWIDPALLPGGFAPLLVLTYAMAPLGGYLVASSTALASRSDRLLWLLSLSLVVAVVLVLAGLPRLLVVGTYRQFQQGFGLQPLAGGALGSTLVWSALVVAPVVVWTTSRLKQLSDAHLRASLPPKS